MNKILNINLGGYAVTIDDDAYEYLLAYLESIRKRFSESEGRDDIIHDIETRLGELITQDMGSRTIVMLPDVEAAVQVMGKPEDFGGETAEPKRSTHSSKSSGSGTFRTGKRLFRDEEDSVVGGICSGLSAYFGISDPVWMRLIFVLLTFLSAGFWVPAYFLLWMLVPPARTAADRLVMRGEPVNVDNIAREIEDGFDRLSHKVNEIGADVKKKGAGGGQNVVSTIVTAIGQIFAFAVRFVVKFGALIAILVGIALFIALTVSWVAGIWSLFAAAPYVDFFSPYSNGITWLGFANLFFLLGIPLIGICLVFSRMLFKVRTPGWLGSSLGLFWLLNLVCGVVLVGLAAREYRQAGRVTTDIDLSGLRSDTLRVEAASIPSDNDEDWWFHEEGVKFSENRLEMNGMVEIMVYPSESGRFECTQTIKAQGASGTEASENAAQTEFTIVSQGNVLRIPTGYSILKGKKWRVQEVKIKIGVPAGKNIVFGKYINDHARSSDYADMGDGPYIRDYPDRVFRMTDRGLVCTDCPQFGDRNYRGDTRYENFILEGDFNTEIRKGDDFRIQMEGPQSERDKIKTLRSGGKITFTTDGKPISDLVKIIIETPVFTSLHTDNTGEVIIRGFEEDNASISARGTSHIKAYLDVRNLRLALSGKCTVSLTGDGGDLEASLTDGATLEAVNWRAESADISASNGSKARVFANREAVTKADSSSKIDVEGTGTVRNSKEEEGN